MTSFNFLFNPLKIFKILIWDKMKWKILTGFIILLVIVLLGLFIYTSPVRSQQQCHFLCRYTKYITFQPQGAITTTFVEIIAKG